MSKWIVSADYDMKDGHAEEGFKPISGGHHIYPRMLPFIPVEARDDKMSQKQREHLSKYVIDTNLVKPHIATIQTTIKSSEPDCWVIGGQTSSPLLSESATCEKYSASAWRSGPDSLLATG